jgi:hypothetical protein
MPFYSLHVALDYSRNRWSYRDLVRGEGDDRVMSWE